MCVIVIERLMNQVHVYVCMHTYIHTYIHTYVQSCTEHTHHDCVTVTMALNVTVTVTMTMKPVTVTMTMKPVTVTMTMKSLTYTIASGSPQSFDRHSSQAKAASAAHQARHLDEDSREGQPAGHSTHPRRKFAGIARACANVFCVVQKPQVHITALQEIKVNHHSFDREQ